MPPFLQLFPSFIIATLFATEIEHRRNEFQPDSRNEIKLYVRRDNLNVNLIDIIKLLMKLKFATNLC